MLLSIKSIKNLKKNYKIIIRENLSYNQVSLGYRRFQIGCAFAEYDLFKNCEHYCK